MLQHIVIFFNLFLIVLAGKLSDNEPTIVPLQLVLNSTDNEGLFYCSGHANAQNGQTKLTVSIEPANMSAPKFDMKIEQTNSTTILIRIQPNGYIGANQINCHWNNNLTYTGTADLIVGDSPGVIQLKQHCLAFDRRYIQCIFLAPIIGRAFKNGFSRQYHFAELNHESFYRSKPRLVDITDDHDLVFHFEPKHRHEIPRRTLMSVNMTIGKFGSSFYRFNVEPLHTTNVDFEINDVSSERFIVDIHHNVTGTIGSRICSGYISHLDQDKTSTTVQNIAATADLKISIKHLHSSTEYKVCLKCYYESSDHSFNEEHCQRTKTSSSRILYLIISFAVLGTVVLSAFGAIVYQLRKRIKLRTRKPKSLSKTVSRNSFPSMNSMPNDRYCEDPTGTANKDITISMTDDEYSLNQHESSNLITETDQYQPFENIMAHVRQPGQISPDTFDLMEQTNSQ